MSYHPHVGPHTWEQLVTSDFLNGTQFKIRCQICGFTKEGADPTLVNGPPTFGPNGKETGAVGINLGGGQIASVGKDGKVWVSGNPPLGQGLGADGHEHVWAYGRQTRRTSNNTIEDYDVRTCEVPGCKIIQRKMHGQNYFTKEERDETLALRKDPLRRVTVMADGTELMSGGTPAAVSGGIVAYDPFKDRVQMGDGAEVDLEILIDANKGVPESLLRERLSNLPAHFFSPQELAERINSLARREAAAQQEKAQRESFMESFASAPPAVVNAFQDLQRRMEASGAAIEEFGNTIANLMNTDDALTLILETIRHAESPTAVRELARTWLTRVTTEISKITRELDEAEDS